MDQDILVRTIINVDAEMIDAAESLLLGRQVVVDDGQDVCDLVLDNEARSPEAKDAAVSCVNIVIWLWLARQKRNVKNTWKKKG